MNPQTNICTTSNPAYFVSCVTSNLLTTSIRQAANGYVVTIGSTEHIASSLYKVMKILSNHFEPTKKNKRKLR